MKPTTFDLPPNLSGQDAARGYVLLAQMTAAELFEAIPSRQARGFFVAIGRRMAALQALDGVKDAVVLRGRVNSFWSTLGWGEADISLQSDAIIVEHRCAPVLVGHDKGEHWPVVVLALLEGAYDHWFREMGSGPTLKTIAGWKGEIVELRHGR